MRQHATHSQPPKGPVATAAGAGPVATVAGASPSPNVAASSPQSVTEQVREAMIREAAYFRAEHRAFAAGSELEDWFDAEREIDAVLTGAKPEPVRKR